MSETHHICLLPGDGIGPEITTEAVKALDALGARFGAIMPRPARTGNTSAVESRN